MSTRTDEILSMAEEKYGINLHSVSPVPCKVFCCMLFAIMVICTVTACGPSPRSTAEKNALTAAKRLTEKGREYEQERGLREAVAKNYVAVAHHYIKEGVRIPDGALNIAAEAGFSDMVKLLSENGAAEKNLALYSACKYGHSKIAMYLLKQGAAPCMQENCKYCLYWAVKHKDQKLAAALIKAKQLDYQEGLAVPLAAEQGDYSMLEFLLKNGCTGKYVELERIIDLPHMNKKFLKLLAAGGADLNPGLAAAVSKGCFQQVKELIDLGVDVHIKVKGWPLTSMTKDRSVLQFLLSKGVNPVSAENDRRIIEIPYAKLNDAEALQWIQLLIKCGANPMINEGRETALAGEFEGHFRNPEQVYHVTNFAAKYGFNKTLNFLFANKYVSNLNAAMREAIHYKHRKTAELLISKHQYRNDIVTLLDKELLKYYVKHGGNLNYYVLYCLTDKTFAPRTKAWEEFVLNAVTESDSDSILKLFENKDFDIAMRLMPKVKMQKDDSNWGRVFSKALENKRIEWAVLLMDKDLLRQETLKDFVWLRYHNKSDVFLNKVVEQSSQASKSRLLTAAILNGDEKFAKFLLSKGADPLFPCSRPYESVNGEPNVLAYVKRFPSQRELIKLMEECSQKIRMEEKKKRNTLPPHDAKKKAMFLFQKGDYSEMYDVLISLKNSNDPEIQGLLGISMVMTFREVDDGFKRVQKSAESDFSKAQLFMGIMYKQGFMKSVKPNQKKAVFWLKKAAAQKEPQAIKLLNQMKAK